MLYSYIYSYSQGVNNDFKSNYHAIDLDCSHFLTLNPTDSREVMQLNDNLEAQGKQWLLTKGLNCKVFYSGECMLKIIPSTKDASGRLAPILITFNLYEIKKNVSDTLVHLINEKLNRELSQETLDKMGILDRYLVWPKWKLFLHVLFTARRSK